MSKYKLYIWLGIFLTITIASAIVPVSVRMRGLGPDLVGIVDDEYSDLFLNPAFINNVEGTRVYTNLSNIHNFGRDLIFAYDYAPDMYYYNLIGGITSVSGHRLGALVELGGTHILYSEAEHETEVSGNEIYIDSTEYDYTMAGTDKSYYFFWGKKTNNFGLGAWIGPHLLNSLDNESYAEISYYYRNDTMFEYELDEEEVNYQASTTAYPFMFGITSGSAENELSASVVYGFDRVHSVVPVDFISSDLEHSIEQTLIGYSELFEKMEQKNEQGGHYVALNARNKKRGEDHSISFLGGVTVVNQPVDISIMDTTYEYSSPSSGFYELEVTKMTKYGKQSMNYLAVGLGVGVEKYFDFSGAKNMFALGIIPSYFGGMSTLTLEPAETHVYYFDNMDDTTTYTVDASENETMEYKNTFGGFQFTFPAGLEMNLTERFAIRLGVTENIMLKYKDVNEETMTDAGWFQHYVSGPFDTTYAEPSDELDSYYSRSEQKISVANSTTYHYGFGYEINDNISLDFTNFADLVNLKSWVLGVNIKW